MKKTGLSLLIATFCIVMVLVFQNCGGGMAPLAGVVEAQSISDIDGSNIPKLLSSSTYAYRKTKGTVIVSKAAILGETTSIIVVMDRTLTGYPVRFYATDSSDEIRISMEGGTVIRVWHISNGTNYAYADIPLPAASTGNKVTVAASFGIAYNDMTMLVNGIRQTLTVNKVGSPYDFSYVQRSVVLAGTGTLDDVAVFSAQISNLDLNVMSRYMANGLNITNVAWDSSLINDDGTGAGAVSTPQFVAAKAIIDANCLGCHNSSNYGDFQNLTQAQFISKGLVVAGSPASSKIYYRLSGALAGSGPANMPQGSALSASDVATIATWINSIQ